MAVEWKLQEALTDSTNSFIDRVRKIIEEMKTKTGNFFKEISDEMEQFNIEFKVYALQEQDKILSQEEEI